MCAQRFTRADAQLRTMKLIVESASELFLGDGFATTSLEAVAAPSGVSHRAVYSTFVGVGALGSAVVGPRSRPDVAASIIGIPMRSDGMS